MAAASSSGGGDVPAASRKRAHHDDGGGGGAQARDQRPSKRKRVGQASVLCMRELFRAVVKDGDISDAERAGLQSVAILLSQIKGDTWVSFPDTDGELAEFSGTRKQMEALREFLGKVAEELKASETSVEVEHQDSTDCFALASVPWADGITSHELLSCCGPDASLADMGVYSFLDKATRPLPSKYMMRSLVRELVKHYYIKRASADARPIEAQPVSDKRSCPKRMPSVVTSCRRRAVAIPRCIATRSRPVLVSVARRVRAYTVSAVANFVVAAVSALVARTAACFQGRNPLWAALRFFCVAFLHGRVLRVLEFLVLMARFRVLLCLASCHEFLGMLFHPFVFVAQKFLRWSEESWLLGCSCDADATLSLLSWVPVRSAELLGSALKLVRFIPGLAFCADPFVYSVDTIQPVLSFVFDLIFSVGIAEGLAMLVSHADENMQPKLLWMSMNVARLLREGDGQAEAKDRDEPGGAEALVDAQAGRGSPGADDPSVRWDPDGAWSLFDAAVLVGNGMCSRLRVAQHSEGESPTNASYCCSQCTLWLAFLRRAQPPSGFRVSVFGSPNWGSNGGL
eukprot:CAMPEP_0179267256 /NCGR_PEP_ID=MMETSP0797-20121207/29832_1 /TAXON_ID=47934 /ORGANISM="Dinophysis acuminata, Strain DAEP01" /LENGTH=570 /DNA_ID=CAMNT_0020975503 /DNA_START=29 /DNA_END=1743 /DNA_ORIENTATION=+